MARIWVLRTQLNKSQAQCLRLNEAKKKESIESVQSKTKAVNQSKSTAKTRYLSGISHELRTPLNVIMGYAQLLEKQAQEEDPNKDKYALMRHNCEHLNHLIEGILEFSAIEAGKLRVQFETVDLHDLIHQLNAMFDHQARKKGLSFSSDVDERLPQLVKTDHKRLQQILMNLLSNAIKFTDTGHIEFNISYRNQVACFTIKDSGCGIDQNDFERIFEPFERIEQPNKPIKGTGLGLPITRLLVDLLGGELTVKSQLQQGSQFAVKLMLAPINSFNQMTEHPVREIKYSQTKTNQQENKLHPILVVDDKKSHRQLLTEILLPNQFKITTAADAIKAQELVQKNHFALAIIDVAMPEINGWQLATWLKTNAPDTKIMMLSANPRDVEASLDRPYDVYLTKPLKINQLMSDISYLLELDWHQSHQTEVQVTSVEHIQLTDTHRHAMLNMLEIGHINGIESYLNKLVEQNLINQQQHEQLSQPVKAMNLNAFKKMIDHE